MFIRNSIFKIKKLGIRYNKKPVINTKSINFNKNFYKKNKVKNNLNKDNIFYSGNQIKRYDHFGFDYDLNSNDYLIKNLKKCK
jgi:mRNA degradation ribonuclease J1/J2